MRTIAFGSRLTLFTRFATRTSCAFGARAALIATLTVAGDAGLATFIARGTFRPRFTGPTIFAWLTLLAWFATFAGRWRLGRLLGELAREVFSHLGRVRNHANGWTGVIGFATWADAVGDTAPTELLRCDDGAWLGGGFAGGADHGKRRKLRMGGFQLGFIDARRRGARGWVLFRRRGGCVGGRIVLPGCFLGHVSLGCGGRIVGHPVKATSAVVAEGLDLRSLPALRGRRGRSDGCRDVGLRTPVNNSPLSS